MGRDDDPAVVAKDVAVFDDAAHLDVGHGEDGLAIFLEGLGGKRDDGAVAVNGTALNVTYRVGALRKDAGDVAYGECQSGVVDNNVGVLSAGFRKDLEPYIDGVEVELVGGLLHLHIGGGLFAIVGSLFLGKDDGIGAWDFGLRSHMQLFGSGGLPAKSAGG